MPSHGAHVAYAYWVCDAPGMWILALRDPPRPVRDPLKDAQRQLRDPHSLVRDPHWSVREEHPLTGIKPTRRGWTH